ncbi:MFS transporter [Candidatus Woesearchaeota archaeon]|jgi:MFS family permease|nr:MFS transporter [Candidatus Woesearchaeota archaeon]MBT4835166.1 MFS transporter [Candidatus Woesearchaeota archaeon]MBT6735241.1 MFS transporter [Candidatus Woesearchaeota archaeon]MBT7169538.1 MFS transporter [Candidatus Woesearchaeota archaeon]MBT7474654.1 MFS transporter [Candidatus Woesearchaeota archaeon]
MRYKKKDLEKNVKLYYTYFIVNRISFLVPILILFWQSFLLSFTQIAIISITFAIAVLLFEIPTGALADTIGRKKVIVASSLLLLFYSILMALPIFITVNAFYIFIVAYFIAGLGVALGSGADSALFYDSLKHLKREKEFSTHFSKFASKTHFIRAIVVIIGGLLGYISLNLPILIQLIPSTITFFVALGFVETSKVKKKSTMQSQIKQIKYSLKNIYQNKIILWLIIFSASFFAFSVMTTEYDEIFLKNVGIPIYIFGFIFASADFLRGYFISKSDKFIKKFKDKLWLVLLILPSIAFLLYLKFDNFYFQVINIILLFIVISSFSLSENVFETTLHDNTKSSMRATVFSVKSMIMNLAYLIMPIFGLLTDKYGLIISTKIFSGISFIILLVIVLFKPKIKTKTHTL